MEISRRPFGLWPFIAIGGSAAMLAGFITGLHQRDLGLVVGAVLCMTVILFRTLHTQEDTVRFSRKTEVPAKTFVDLRNPNTGETIMHREIIGRNCPRPKPGEVVRVTRTQGSTAWALLGPRGRAITSIDFDGLNTPDVGTRFIVTNVTMGPPADPRADFNPR